MRILWIAGGAVTMLVAAHPAIAAQCATVAFSPSNVSLPSYDPIAGGDIATSFTATITRVSGATTSVRLVFVDSDNNSSPPRLGANGNAFGPSYDILDTGGINVAFPRGTNVTGKSNPKISLPSGPSGDAVSVGYLVRLPANNLTTDYRNGTYGETLTYSLQCFQGEISQASDTHVTGPSLSVTIPNLVSLTTSGPETLDFQNFTALSQQLNVGLKSTGPINVDLRTANQRKMILTGAPSPPPLNSYIDYSITLNGYSASADPYILTNAPRAGVAGKYWPLKLILHGQPSGKVAGTYSDTITLTVTPGS